MNNYLEYNDDFWKSTYLDINKIEPHKLWGSVLYLGMGTSLIPRLQSDKVLKTTIVEIDKDTIDFNIKNQLIKEGWIIIEADAYKYETNELYDFIFIDIFYHSIDKDIMNLLIEKYRHFLTKEGTILYLQSVVK